MHHDIIAHLDIAGCVLPSLEDIDQLVQEEGGGGDGDPLPGMDAPVHPNCSGVCPTRRSSNLHQQDFSSFMTSVKNITFLLKICIQLIKDTDVPMLVRVTKSGLSAASCSIHAMIVSYLKH